MVRLDRRAHRRGLADLRRGRLGTWWPVGISFVIGFTVRLLALYQGWEEPLAKEPAGMYQHSDGRPLLGRKIAGKSQRELHDLGLAVENPAPGEDS